MHRPLMLAASVAMVLAVSAFVSCSDDEEPVPAPAGTKTATPVAAMTASPTATSATPPPADLRPPYGVVLIDVRSGDVRSLVEGDHPVHTGGFEADGTVWVSVSPPPGTAVARLVTSQVFDASGNRLPDPPPGSEPASCGPMPMAASSGVPSPDCKHVLYFVDIDDPHVQRGRYAAYLL